MTWYELNAVLQRFTERGGSAFHPHPALGQAFTDVAASESAIISEHFRSVIRNHKDNRPGPRVSEDDQGNLYIHRSPEEMLEEHYTAWFFLTFGAIHFLPEDGPVFAFAR